MAKTSADTRNRKKDRKRSDRPGRKRRNRPSLASRADRYDLYQQSVQEPEYEVEFFDRVFRAYFDRPPLVLREDFCGTAAVGCAWVASRPDRRAVAIDIDPEPLAWCRRHNFPRLTPSMAARIELVSADAHSSYRLAADIISVQNFSFFYFRQRGQLLEYLRAVHRNLAQEGLVILDMVGGGEVLEEDHEEVTEKDGFDYIWEQHSFDPISAEQVCFIHFRFPDGSELNRAFEYRWRLWTLPELRELLLEAGFGRADVYWEGTDDDTGDGDGIFERADRGTSDPAWIAYVVGVK